MKNQPHFSPLHVALVTGLASLVGFLAGRTVWLEYGLSLLVSVSIGLIATIIVGLLAFQPYELLISFGHALRASKGKWMQSYRERCIEKERSTKVHRTHSFRRQAYYEKIIRRTNRRFVYYTMKLVVVWVVVIVASLCLLVYTMPPPYNHGGVHSLVVLGFVAIASSFTVLVANGDKKKQLKRCIPSYGSWGICPTRRWILGIFRPMGEIAGYCRCIEEGDGRATDKFRNLCERLVDARKKRYKEWNPFAVTAKLFCELISFIVTIPQLLVQSCSFLRWLAATSALVCAKFFAIMYLKVNTTQRNSILWFSLAGFFIGFLAHCLGAHASAPFWAFGAGFFLSLFQYYVYQRFAHRLEIFIDRHSTSGHLS